MDIVDIYDIEEALKRPQVLDSRSGFRLSRPGVEENAAAFLARSNLVITTSNEADLYDPAEVDADDLELPEPDSIAIYDLEAKRCRSWVRLQEPAGTLMPVGTDFVVGFYQHPKLISIATGQVVQRWPELKSGEQRSSIIHHHSLPPPLALDPKNKRLAILNDSEIVVIQLG